MNRQKKVLLSLFGLLLLAIIYAYWMMPEQRRQPALAGGGQSEVVAADREKSGQPRKDTLRIDLLNKEPTRYKGPKRDIFNFATVSKKPATKPKVTVVKPAVKPRPIPSVVTPVVRQQLARFTFLGFLVKDERHTVFLSRGEELFLVQEKDHFGDDKQFTVVSISPEVMQISQSGDSRNIEIRLVEKEPLVPTMQQPDVSKVQPQSSLPKNRWPQNKLPNIKR